MSAKEKPTNLIAKFAAAIMEVGGQIPASGRNEQQRYDYIPADEVLHICGQALADQGLSLLVSIAAEEILTTPLQNNKQRYDAQVDLGIILTDGEDERVFTWRGRGSDYGVPDKALYKAITSGHKYWLMKNMLIGSGNPDGEHDSPQEEQSPQAGRPERHAGNGNGKAKAANKMGVIQEGQRRRLFALGVSFYGKEKWDGEAGKQNGERHRLVYWRTDGRTKSSTQLTQAQADSLIEGLEEKILAESESTTNVTPPPLSDEEIAANAPDDFEEAMDEAAHDKSIRNDPPENLRPDLTEGESVPF